MKKDEILDQLNSAMKSSLNLMKKHRVKSLCFKSTLTRNSKKEMTSELRNLAHKNTTQISFKQLITNFKWIILLKKSFKMNKLKSKTLTNRLLRTLQHQQTNHSTISWMKFKKEKKLLKNQEITLDQTSKIDQAKMHHRTSSLNHHCILSKICKKWIASPTLNGMYS